MEPRPTVFIVDDDAAVRESLRWLLESAQFCVRAYGSAEAFLGEEDAVGPGCVLLDVRMPGMSGLELQQKLRARLIRLPVVVITGHADVSMAVAAMKAGAVDFIQKPFEDEALLRSIRTAIDHDINRCEEADRRNEILARAAQLTHRERQVFELVVKGWSNARTAKKLGVVPKTVEAHRANVMRKMQAESLAGLVRLTTIAGL